MKHKFKILLMFFAMPLLWVHCEKEDLHETAVSVQQASPKITVKRVSLDYLKQKETLGKKIQKLAPVLDVSKNIQKNGITSNDGSFTIRTDEILEVTTETTETYTFRIEIPTDSNAAFENFVIEKINDDYRYWIFKFVKVPETDDSYKVYKRAVDQNQFDITGLEDFLKLIYYDEEMDCLWETYPGTPLSRNDTYRIICCPCNGGGDGSDQEGTTDTNGDTETSSTETGDTGTEGNTGGSTSGTTDTTDDPNSPVGVLPEDDGVSISDCKLLENLSNSVSFQQRMQELIANTTGNTEIAYWGRTDNNDETNYEDTDRFESDENTAFVDLTLPTTPVNSFVHNHFNNGTGSLSVFSGSDLLSLYTLYINGLISDAGNFVMVVTTPGNDLNDTSDDTVYAITISNETDFQRFGAFYLSNLLIIDPLYEDFRISANISTALNEKRLAQLLKNQKLGMSLFRGDKNNLNNWTKLEIRSNEELKETNCN